MRYFAGSLLTLLTLVIFLLPLGVSFSASHSGYLVDRATKVRLCPDCVSVYGHPYSRGQRVRLYETVDGWTRISPFVNSDILREVIGRSTPSRAAFWVSDRSYVIRDSGSSSSSNNESLEELLVVRASHLYDLRLTPAKSAPKVVAATTSQPTRSTNSNSSGTDSFAAGRKRNTRRQTRLVRIVRLVC